MLSKLLYGTRTSLAFGLLLTILGSILGIIFGTLQGYFGGKTDILIGRLIEIWASMPSLFLILMIPAPTVTILISIMLFFNWLSLANTIRIEFLRARTLDYVIASQALGLHPIKIIIKHILPNAYIGVKSHFPFIFNLSLVQLASFNFLSNYKTLFQHPSLGDLLLQDKYFQTPWLTGSIIIVMTLTLSLLIFISEELNYYASSS
ncbi:MAG: ABC transporter permease subunit [Alphaproteobacteria bacterium]|nr:MAG: ABC transporter permease subunit [Alphaproteobacteria bacterium]